MATDTAFEKHYTISELVAMWGWSKETVRRLVRLEPDVVKKIGPNGKTSYRVPESVARRIHTRLMGPRRPHLALAK